LLPKVKLAFNTSGTHISQHTKQSTSKWPLPTRENFSHLQRTKVLATFPSIFHNHLQRC